MVRWVKAENNPGAQIAENLNRRNFSHCNLVCMEVAVESSSLYSFLERALLEYKPQAWIGLGVASNRPVISPELVGINWLHFTVPDISGAMLQATPILDEGPVAYHSDLPNEEFVKRLKEAQIPAALSFHAGTHLCNQMLYSVRHLITLFGLKTLSGFIHVPHTPENMVEINDLENLESSMSLSLMTRAIEICVEETAKKLTSCNHETQ